MMGIVIKLDFFPKSENIFYILWVSNKNLRLNNKS